MSQSTNSHHLSPREPRGAFSKGKFVPPPVVEGRTSMYANEGGVALVMCL